MSNDSTPYLLALPTELIHCILDKLETNDRLFLFRNICVRFYRIANCYVKNEITIKDTSSTSYICRICQIIRPDHVTALTVIARSDSSSQIELFLSNFDVSQACRLQSLNLYGVKGQILTTILNHIQNIPTLRSLSLEASQLDNLSENTIDCFSKILTRPRFYELKLSYIDDQIFSIFRSRQCALKVLSIEQCSLTDLFEILISLPNLRKFSSIYFSMQLNSVIRPANSFYQLTSLTLKSFFITADLLEALVLHTKLLVFLHIVDSFSTLTFIQRLSQWEQFITDKLPFLRHFRFFVRIQGYTYNKIDDIESIMSSFRTPFWLIIKRWYVTCQYIKNEARADLILYSPADTNVTFPDNLTSGILSYCTSTKKDDSIGNNFSIWSARFNLSGIIDAINSNDIEAPNTRLFRNTAQLSLDIEWPIGPLTFLSGLVNLSQLTEIWLFISNYNYFDATCLDALLNLVTNIQILGISYDDDSMPLTAHMCSVISGRVEHIKMYTTDIESIQETMESIHNVRTITLIRNQTSKHSWIDTMQWLTETGRRFSRSDDYRYLHVWLDENPSE